MHEGYSSRSLCVCLSVCYHASRYIPGIYNASSKQGAITLLKHFNVCGFHQKHCSKVLATFADYHDLSRDIWTPMQTLKTIPAIQTLETNPANQNPAHDPAHTHTHDYRACTKG